MSPVARYWDGAAWQDIGSALSDPPAFVSTYNNLAGSINPAGQTWTVIPVSAAVDFNAPAGAFTRNADGSVSVRDAGVYNVAATVAMGVAPNANARSIYGLTWTPSTGVPADAATAPDRIARADMASFATTTFPWASLSGQRYFAAGTKIWVTAWIQAGSQVYLNSFSIVRQGGAQGPPGAPATELYAETDGAADGGVVNDGVTWTWQKLASGADLTITIPSQSTAQTWIVYGSVLVRANSANDTAGAYRIEANPGAIAVGEARHGRWYWSTGPLASWETMSIPGKRLAVPANTSYTLRHGAMCFPTFGGYLNNTAGWGVLGARRIG